MDLLSTFRIALRALRTNTLRSMLTMLGIIIGVAAVIAMVSSSVHGDGDPSVLTTRIR